MMKLGHAVQNSGSFERNGLIVMMPNRYCMVRVMAGLEIAGVGRLLAVIIMSRPMAAKLCCSSYEAFRSMRMIMPAR